MYHGGQPSGQNLASISSKLPAVGAKLISKHGIEWKVDGHISTSCIANKPGDRGEHTLYPVIYPQNLSPRFEDFLSEVARCTPKVILPLDTLPSIFPTRAHSNGHWIDAWSDPENILIFLDAANTSETVLAHELAHAWIDLVRDIEDYRVWSDREDYPRYRQIQTLQSFVLDVAVDKVLHEKGFDHGVIDCDNEIASMQLRVAAERGYNPENLREGLFVATHLATSLINKSESKALAKMLDVMPVVRRNLPELHALAEGMATAVLDSMPTDRTTTTNAIDQVFQLAFSHTDPGLDYSSLLITVEPAVNWEMDKSKGWLTGQTPRGKCEIGVAMARLGATSEHTPVLQQVNNEPVTVRFTHPDGSETEKVPLQRVRMPEDPRITHANAMMEESRQNKKRIEEMKNMNKSHIPNAPGIPHVGPQMPNIPGLNFPPRTYSAGTARWITQVRMDQMLAGEHPYSYANNNPITLIDPSGNQFIDPLQDYLRGWEKYLDDISKKCFPRRLPDAEDPCWTCAVRAIADAKAKLKKLGIGVSPIIPRENAIGHCTTACTIARICPECVPYWNDREGNCRWGDIESCRDLHNNLIGIELSRQKGNCADLCAASRRLWIIFP